MRPALPLCLTACGNGVSGSGPAAAPEGVDYEIAIDSVRCAAIASSPVEVRLLTALPVGTELRIGREATAAR